MRNQPGNLAMVSPYPEAATDIRDHAGKVVTVVMLVPCAIGGDPGWMTAPGLLDAYGNEIAWDDGDLTPLTGNPDGKQLRVEDSIAV